MLFISIQSAKAATPTPTINWTGNGTNGSWTNTSNWTPARVPVSTDVVGIGVSYQLTNNNNIPVLSTAGTTTIAALVFGGYFDSGDIYFPGISVSTGCILKVTADITFIVDGNPGSFNYGSQTIPSNQYYIEGAGTIQAVNMNIFANYGATSASTTEQLVLSSINSLILSGNMSLSSENYKPGGTTYNQYATFFLTAGTTEIDGSIITANTVSGTTTYPTSEVQINPASSAGAILKLGGATALSGLSASGTNIIDVNNQYATTNYSGTSQTVYTSSAANVSGGAGVPYYNLILSGSGTETVASGTLTVGNDLTTSATTNFSATTTANITDDWVTSGNATQGASNINVNNVMQINGNTVTCGSGTLTVTGQYQNNSGTLQCGAGSVIFKGGYLNSSVFIPGTGTVYFTGTQTLEDNGTTGTTFNNVTFNGTGTTTATITSGGTSAPNFAVSSTGILTMTSPAKLVAGPTTAGTAGYLTLNSNATSSAAVAAYATGSTSTITGNVNVQRYVPAGTIANGNRNYRLFSSPVNQSGYNSFYYLSNNYTGVTTGFSPIYSGTPLTSFSTLGFTAKTGNPTMYLYDGTGNAALNSTTYNGGTFKGLASLASTTGISYFNSDNYATAPSTVSNGIPPGNGVMAYYIGNNTSVASANSNPTTSTVTAVGTLNQGQIAVKMWKSNLAVIPGSSTVTTYALVGNPYPSSISWSTEQSATSTTGIYLQGMATVIYEFDYRTKNYGTYDPAASPVATGNGSNIITSGQGFYVVPKTTSASTLTFNESAKATAQPTVLLFNSAAPTVAKQLLSIKLAKDTLNTDNIFVLFEPASKNGFERFYDDERLNGIGNIATLGSYASDSTELLAINRMHSIDSTTKVKLYVNVANSTGVDTLSATGFDVLDQRYDVYLIDHFKKDSLLFSKYPKYLFNINNSDTTTFGANRFEIVFHKKAALAYRLISFTGAVVPGGIKLSWTTQNEQNLTGFNLQRLDGSKVFIGLDSLQSNGSGSYSYLDRSPLAGTNVYRLLQDDAFNDISFSNVISITINPSGSAVEPLSIYPNPVTTMLNVKINSATLPDKVILTITDLVGRKIITRETSASNIQQPVSNLLTGDYIIQIADDANNIIGTKKFIKQ